MSSDTQFTAHGRAIVGFQTNGSRIERGADVAGTVIGAVARGPVGVQARGDEIGVDAVGGTVGIDARGRSGYGGIFRSDGQRAQVQLAPKRIEPMRPVTLEPADPHEMRNMPLPRAASVGDLLMTTFSTVHGETETRASALWLCVGRTGSHALWREVLLGHQVPGTVAPPPDNG